MAQKVCYGCMKMKTQSPVCEHCGFDERTLNLNHQLPIGAVLSQQYVLGRVLGQGGFGITYIGWDRTLDMPVAIKEYFPNGIVYRNIGMGLNVQSYAEGEDEVFRKHRNRFIREARSLAKLSVIPEVVQVKNFFEENNTAYIVMEYVDGITLKNYIKLMGRPLTVTETLQIMDPILRGMAQVHEMGMIHRDISPDNIMLQAEGGVKIIDFGTVRVLNDMQLSKSTESVLKPGYAPMEQYNTSGNIGSWTDVYALCATIHYCLSGVIPADAPSRLENGEKLTALENIPSIPKQFIRVLEKGMRIRYSERTQNVAELYNNLYAAHKGTFVDDSPVEKPYTNTGTVPGNNTGTVKNGNTNGAAGKTDNSKSGKALAVVGVVAALMAFVVAGGLLFTQKKSEPKPTEPVVQVTVPRETEAVPQQPAWKANVLMSDNVTDHDSAKTDAIKDNWPVFGSAVSRSKICAVTFLNTTANAPASSWDVSEDKNGKVLAWIESEGSQYHLYIAGDGGINGTKSSDELFYHYRNLERVEFNDCYYTDDATSFSGMFNNCEKLTELDLSSFNTKKVLSMAIMFQGCGSLRKLDISSFDTARVNNMTGMFNGVHSLKKLKVDHFDTGRVTKYTSFYHLDRLPDGTYWLDLFE